MMLEKLVFAWVVVGWLAVPSLPAWAATPQEEAFKKIEEEVERTRKQHEQWLEDYKRYREDQKRVLASHAMARQREAELKQYQEAKVSAELASAKSAREIKALKKALRESKVRLELAERERQAELLKLSEEDEQLRKRREEHDKAVEELRKQGKLGGEIQFGMDI
jgi:hypothetical protein